MCSRERLSFFGRLSDALLNEQQLVAALRSELAERTRAALSDKTAQVSTTKENDFDFDFFFFFAVKKRLLRLDVVSRSSTRTKLLPESAKLRGSQQKWQDLERFWVEKLVVLFVLSFFFSPYTVSKKGQDDC
jgi:hypothetical protein